MWHYTHQTSKKEYLLGYSLVWTTPADSTETETLLPINWYSFFFVFFCASANFNVTFTPIQKNKIFWCHPTSAVGSWRCRCSRRNRSWRAEKETYTQEHAHARVDTAIHTHDRHAQHTIMISKCWDLMYITVCRVLCKPTPQIRPCYHEWGISMCVRKVALKTWLEDKHLNTRTL